MATGTTYYVKRGHRYEKAGVLQDTRANPIPNGDYLFRVRDGSTTLIRLPDVHLGFIESDLEKISEEVSKAVVELVMGRTHSAFDIGQSAAKVVRDFLRGEKVQ